MATLRELLLRDITDIKYYISGGACKCPQGIIYPYYIGDTLYYDTSALYDGYLALKATPEYQEIILGQVPPPPPGTKSGNSGIIISAGLLGLALALIKGKKK